MNSETFWMVWNSKSGMPKLSHSTLESAQREAERIARLDPGARIVILQAIEAVQVCDIQRTKLSDVPF